MIAQKHIIRKQTFELTLRNKKDAWNLRQKFADLYQRTIVPRLDEVFSQFSDTETILQIDRLEIDLGTLPLAHLDEELAEKVCACMYEELIKQRNHSLQGTSPKKTDRPFEDHSRRKDRAISQQVFELEVFQFFLRTGTLPWWAETQSPDTLAEIVRRLCQDAPHDLQALIKAELPKKNARQRLIYQLSDQSLMQIVAILTPDKAGQVQQWMSDLQAMYHQIPFEGVSKTAFRLWIWEAILTAILRRDQTELTESNLIRSILESLAQKHIAVGGELHQKNARHWFIQHLSDQALMNIVAMLTPGKAGQVQQWLNDVNALYQQIQFEGVSKPEFRLWIWEAVLTTILLHGSTELTESNLVRGMLESLARGQHVTVYALIQRLRDAMLQLSQSHFTFQSSCPTLIERLAQEIVRDQRFSKHDKNDFSPSDEWKERTHIPSPYAQISDQGRSVRQNSNFTGIAEESPPITDETDMQELYIQNSGLVLLWPYLRPFFTHLGLLLDGKFVDEPSVARAVHLLQYLVTGEQDHPEHLLVLNKLLCGWELLKPISRDFDVSDAERAESEQVLHSVIDHWSALKNTSIEGFRTSFLQRNGVMTEQSNTWVVRVERKAYDLLLDRLPWSLSMIKLSWMKTILYVEWSFDSGVSK